MTSSLRVWYIYIYFKTNVIIRVVCLGVWWARPRHKRNPRLSPARSSFVYLPRQVLLWQLCVSQVISVTAVESILPSRPPFFEFLVMVDQLVGMWLRHLQDDGFAPMHG